MNPTLACKFIHVIQHIWLFWDTHSLIQCLMCWFRRHHFNANLIRSYDFHHRHLFFLSRQVSISICIVQIPTVTLQTLVSNTYVCIYMAVWCIHSVFEQQSVILHRFSIRKYKEVCIFHTTELTYFSLGTWGKDNFLITA